MNEVLIAWIVGIILAILFTIVVFFMVKGVEIRE